MATSTLLFLRNYTFNRLGCLISQPWSPAAMTSDPIAMQRFLLGPCPHCCGRAAITTKGPCATNYFSKKEAEKSFPTSVGHLVICLRQWPCRAGRGLLIEPGVCQTVMGAGPKQAPWQPVQAERGRDGWFTAPILTCQHVCRLTTSSPAALSKAGVESSQRHGRGLHTHAVSGREAGVQQALHTRPQPRAPPPPPPPRSPAAPRAIRAPAPPPGAPAAGEGEASEETRGTKGRDQKKE